MPINPSRAAEVKAAAVVLWKYIVPFMIANAHRRSDDTIYAGLLPFDRSHANVVKDNEAIDPELNLEVQLSTSIAMQIDMDNQIGTDPQTGLPIYGTKPVKGPTLGDLRDFIVANEDPVGDLATITALMRHAKLHRPTVFDARTRAHPDRLGFYIVLDVEATDGAVWRLQKCKCWGDDPWKSNMEAAHTNMDWTLVVDEQE